MRRLHTVSSYGITTYGMRRNHLWYAVTTYGMRLHTMSTTSESHLAQHDNYTPRTRVTSRDAE